MMNGIIIIKPSSGKCQCTNEVILIIPLTKGCDNCRKLPKSTEKYAYRKLTDN